MNRPRLRKRVYRIGESPLLTVYSDNGAALDALELRPDDTVEPPQSPSVEIFLLGGKIADFARVEFPETATTVHASDTVSIRSDGSRHYGSWYGKAASVADAGTGRAIISVPGLRHYNPDFVSRLVFRPVLDRLLLDRGWLPLHAAACAENGRGCLLAGDTGSGKTTLLLRLLEEGAGFLADDRTLVREEGGRFRVHAFPERLRIVTTTAGRKRSRSAPGPMVSIVEAEMIVFLDPGRRDAPQVNRIGTAEALARLSRSVSPYLEPRERKELLPSIERLCRGAACFAVRGWSDPEDRAALVGNLLRKEMPR